ncbi:TetR/AcrR family transcriptional regulator [Nesterenkonia alba]|uniref:TetR/AcrR family transcriptional regulator n=1 Tax=Nesterenkonia alba TaxID=515814 RepID=UPI0012EC275C|nr:TetR/AcrR family transcriptional regulator [Nesterenkonia alba]
MPERGYHHGDLRNALLAATRELVRQRGARGFSVSEAARQVGVSSSAPYRHFADRDALLAATALEGFLELEEQLAELQALETLPHTAAQITTAYLRFAHEDPARFEVMFAHGLDKTQHEDLLQQTFRIQDQLNVRMARHLPRAQATQRAAELWSLAHGLATLSIGGNVQHVLPEVQIGELAASAAKAWARGLTQRPGD